MPRNVTTAQDDPHVVRMATTDCIVLSPRWNTAMGVELSASKGHHQLLIDGLVVRLSLRRLPLSINHQILRIQWARERRHWRSEWQNLVFSDKPRFKLPYNCGRICVRRYRCELHLRTCLVEQHSRRFGRHSIYYTILPPTY